MNETKIIKLFKEGMIFMRKFKILALLLMASLVFAGCSKEEKKETTSTEQKN